MSHTHPPQHPQQPPQYPQQPPQSQQYPQQPQQHQQQPPAPMGQPQPIPGSQPPQGMHQAPQPHQPAAHDPKAEQTATDKPKPRDKAHDAQMAFALLLTDWLHGDRHYQVQLTELARGLLTDLGGGPDVTEPDDQQVLAQEAMGRIEGMPTDIRAAQDQPAQRMYEARQYPPGQEAARMPMPTKAN